MYHHALIEFLAMYAVRNFPMVKALVLCLGLLITPAKPVLAQSFDGNDPATPSDTTLVSAIAPYRDAVRRSVLLASQQPQVLTRLAQQQTSSQQEFYTLIQSYGHTKQGWFYDIARYPDVLHELATLPARAEKARGRTITRTLPPESQTSAWRLYRHHHGELVQADSINQRADRIFDSLMGPLDGTTQKAFRQLMTLPDLMTLLTREIDRTKQLGQAYLADSAGITRQLITMHDSLALQNRRELADYQQQLNQDPLAQQDLQLAGQAYALMNRYNPGINPNPASPDSLYYYQNPYSFWSGYPFWYNIPLWYPSSGWYGTGFQYGSGGNMVLFGLPSPNFCNWFFTRAYRAYPHLYRRFNDYYARNIGDHRFWSRGNAGFMAAAHRHFGPANDTRSGHGNWLSSPRPYSRSSGGSGSGFGVRTTTSSSHYRSTPSRSFHASSGSRSFSGSHSHSGGFHSSSSHSGGGHSGGGHHSGHR